MSSVESSYQNESPTMLRKVQIFRHSRIYKLFKWGFLAIVAFLAWVLFDFESIRNNLNLLSIGTILISLFFLLSARILYCVRWYTLLHGLGVETFSPIYLLRVLLLAEFVGIVMPSYLGGDGVRWLKLEKHTDKPGVVATSILIDRVTGLVTLMMAALFVLEPLNNVINLDVSLWSIVIVSGIIILLVILILLYFWPRGRILLKSVAVRFSIKPGYIITAFILSIIGHFAFAQAYYVLFAHLIPVNYWLVMSITLIALATRSIPISFLGIEASDGSLIALGGLIGIQAETILVVLVIVVGSRYFFALIGLLTEILVDGRYFFQPTN